MTTLTRQQIESLWTQAGGNPQQASMASAIALAESGGRTDASNTNDNGTIDRGLWQINSIHGGQSTFDPLANARAAVSISANGSNWRPWCTAWSNGRCGGTFMGGGSPVLKFLGASAPTASPSNPDLQPVGLFNPLSPNAWAEAFLKPVSVWLWYGLMYSAGLLLVLIGLWLLVRETSMGERAEQYARQAIRVGVSRGRKRLLTSPPPVKEATEKASTEKTKTYEGKHRTGYRGRHAAEESET